jgi:hypothetical protein
MQVSSISTLDSTFRTAIDIILVNVTNSIFFYNSVFLLFNTVSYLKK